MKKLVAVIFTVILTVSVLTICVSAEEINPDGYAFDISGVNTKIESENAIIVTKQEVIADANLKWAVVIYCEKVEDSIYKVKADTKNPSGNPPELTLGNDEIVIGVHSSTSDTSLIDEYPNAIQKVTALEVKAGMFFKLEGIDLESGEVTDGKAVCSAKQPASDVTDESKTEESKVVSEDEGSKEEESKEVSKAEPEESVVLDDESSQAPESNESAMPTDDDGMDTVTIILICAAAVILIAVISIIAANKKKK